MPTLTTVAKKYVNCYGSTVTIGGVIQGSVEKGGFDVEISVDETTNNSGGGGYEDESCITKYTGTFSVAVKAASIPAIEGGLVYPMIVDNPTAYLDIDVRITKISKPVLDTHAAVHFTYSWTGQGLARATVKPVGP